MRPCALTVTDRGHLRGRTRLYCGSGCSLPAPTHFKTISRGRTHWCRYRRRLATYTGEASGSARSSPSYPDYPALLRSGHAVYSGNQTDSYRTPAIRKTGGRKSQNQGAEGSGRDNRLQVPDDLASASQYGCRACMAPRRDQENWQTARLMIFLSIDGFQFCGFGGAGAPGAADTGGGASTGASALQSTAVWLCTISQSLPTLLNTS